MLGGEETVSANPSISACAELPFYSEGALHADANFVVLCFLLCVMYVMSFQCEFLCTLLGLIQWYHFVAFFWLLLKSQILHTCHI